MEDVLKEAPYVVLRNGQWQLRISSHRKFDIFNDFLGCSIMQWQTKHHLFYHLYGFSGQMLKKILGFQNWWFLELSGSSCRVCEANFEISLEPKLIESTKTCFETARKISLLRRLCNLNLKHPWISNKWSNLSVLCVINSNVPWLCHEILRQILPPWGRAPICPLRKGNTSPEIRLPH